MKKTKFLKVQLYVLGMLARYGPQHGYSVKQRLGEQVADFARIELGNIYYHLKRMEGAGWVSATSAREGKRPERSVFAITKAGEEALDNLLRRALNEEYWTEFSIDAALFFSDRFASQGATLMAALTRRDNQTAEILGALREHRKAVLPRLPPLGAVMASALFRHHELHYEAELNWIHEVLHSFESWDQGRKPKE